jgi:hypothetical protein
MDLEQALTQFDRTDANLRALEDVVERLQAMIPDGIVFAGGSPEGREHDELRRRYAELVTALPALEGFRIDAEPLRLDDVAQWRMDAFEASIPESLVELGQEIAAPHQQVAEYRHRFERLRRELSRRRITELVAEIDAMIGRIAERNPHERGSVSDDPEWPPLREATKQLRRLAGDTAAAGAWSTLARHLSFGDAVDLRDIVERDWPSVRAAVEAGMYAEGEPLPVEADDLATLVAQQPTGPVSTALRWEALDSETFERLIFNLLRDAPGYHNAQWLTATHAPDRGRDLSVERDLPDALGTARRERVMVQCKHWRARSVRPPDASEAVTQAEMWQPPFDALIIATSGRFTADAVTWIEGHNQRNRLKVDMWPESHLEMLLAERPWLVEQMGLRAEGDRASKASRGGR